MSAFNQARFNAARFNVQSAEVAWATGEAKVSVGFSFAGTTCYAIGSSNVRVLASSLKLDRGRMASGGASEQFTKEAEINGYFWPDAASGTVFTGEINLSQIIEAAGAGKVEVLGDPNLSQIVKTAGSAAVEVLRDLNLSQIVEAAADSGVIFSVSADVINQVEYVCEFPGLTLRPGQVLVIDAGSYNVLLDGENAIHMQQGDWLDSIDRNTQSIVISATGISRVTAEILYTERYL